ncbi:thioredoxin [Streptomyces daqingensis]|uniref:Thioredoxin n=1 Tax=Streptomyces daqingensis TaxID=1472640 RepID=A0ABQ2LZD4_9ACTN|nr:nitrogen fixation protein NifU [Streptomyces daqingensis]GGO44966.1 thioredoxin [Streptomyces daqingensis]
MVWEEREAREHVARTEKLLSALGGIADAGAREQALDALHALAELYGECLARVMRCADEKTTDAVAADELVSHLLLVHDLHPEPAGERVRRALDGMPGVTVLAVEEPAVRVALRPQGCGAPSGEQLADAVREAVAWAAPEFERVETEKAGGDAETLIPVDSLFRGPVQPAGNR